MAKENNREDKIKEEAKKMKNENQSWPMCYRGNGLKIALIAIGGLLILVSVFSIIRSYSGDRLIRNRAFNNEVPQSRMGMMGGRGYGFDGNEMRGRDGFGRSTSGKITAINGSNLTVKTDDQEVTVTISSDTSIYDSDRKIAKQSDLKVDDEIIVMGRPDSNGTVPANVIYIK